MEISRTIGIKSGAERPGLFRPAAVVLALLFLNGCTHRDDDMAATPSRQDSTPMSGPKSAESGPETDLAESAAHAYTNRLARASSPYLLLHAHNPVDWHPWSPEVFRRAKEEDKPVFLSIGYSSCYWCHVMERLVFSNEEIARYMNEHFINVKVDREERPDVDDIYMTSLHIYFQLSGIPQGGGWPLSMFLTPSGKPFAGGTYFPPEDAPGQIGFPAVMRRVVELWRGERNMVERNADLIVQNVRQALKTETNTAPSASRLDRSLVDAAVQSLQESFDPEFGGLDFNPQNPNAPKFPVPSKLVMLLSETANTPDASLMESVLRTLDFMAAGGIRDHVGGGFHRYSTDRQWLVPHFEKMLYDNAQLAEVYVAAYLQTGKPLYRHVAEETYEFVLREMTDVESGFYSAIDAETNTIEGRFYVWSAEEIDGVLGEEDATLFKRVYGIVDRPAFEYGNVIHIAVPIEKAAEEIQIEPELVQERLTLMRRKLLDARNRRERPLCDDKVLTSWNGLMIRSFAYAGAELHRADYTAAAERAAMFVLERLRDDQGRLLHSYCRGTATLNAYLDDYAFLISGLLTLHETTGDEKWVNAARRLADDQVRLFWDSEEGGFYFTSFDHEELLARPKDIYDSVLPSGNSVSAANFVQLARRTSESQYRDYARKTLELFSPQIQESPRGTALLAAALSGFLHDATQVPANSPTLPSQVSGQEILPASGQVVQKSKDKPKSLVSFVAIDRKDNMRVGAKAYLAHDRLIARERCPIALLLDIAPGWHINTNPAQPAFLIPTAVSLKSKHGTTVVDVVYPAGHEFQLQGFDEPLRVYEKQVLIRATLAVPAVAAMKTEELEFEIRYQACNDRTCEPPKKIKFNASIPVGSPGTKGHLVNPALLTPVSAEKRRSDTVNR